jgi:hypothetical protein
MWLSLALRISSSTIAIYNQLSLLPINFIRPHIFYSYLFALYSFALYTFQTKFSCCQDFKKIERVVKHTCLISTAGEFNWHTLISAYKENNYIVIEWWEPTCWRASKQFDSHTDSARVITVRHESNPASNDDRSKFTQLSYICVTVTL